MLSPGFSSGLITGVFVSDTYRVWLQNWILRGAIRKLFGSQLDRKDTAQDVKAKGILKMLIYQATAFGFHSIGLHLELSDSVVRCLWMRSQRFEGY